MEKTKSLARLISTVTLSLFASASFAVDTGVSEYTCPKDWDVGNSVPSPDRWVNCSRMAVRRLFKEAGERDPRLKDGYVRFHMDNVLIYYDLYSYSLDLKSKHALGWSYWNGFSLECSTGGFFISNLRNPDNSLNFVYYLCDRLRRDPSLPGPLRTSADRILIASGLRNPDPLQVGNRL